MSVRIGEFGVMIGADGVKVEPCECCTSSSASACSCSGNAACVAAPGGWILYEFDEGIISRYEYGPSASCCGDGDNLHLRYEAIRYKNERFRGPHDGDLCKISDYTWEGEGVGPTYVLTKTFREFNDCTTLIRTTVENVNKIPACYPFHSPGHSGHTTWWGGWWYATPEISEGVVVREFIANGFTFTEVSTWRSITKSEDCFENQTECGACCIDGLCWKLSEADCAARGGTYAGGGTSCATHECARPCCTDGVCALKTRTDCLAGGGTPMAPGECETSTCHGACCEESGGILLCTEKAEPDCTGEWRGLGSRCGGTVCTQELGACCHHCGGCSLTTPLGCRGFGDEWGGEGSVCEPSPCAATGACCVDGACMIVTHSCCVEMSGTYHGAGTDCDPDPCAEDHGSCCHSDGSCTEGTLAACANAGGSYQGHGTECASTVCPLEPGPICNACCTPEGACSGVTSSSNCPAPNSYHPGLGCPGSGCASEIVCSITESLADNQTTARSAPHPNPTSTPTSTTIRKPCAAAGGDEGVCL